LELQSLWGVKLVFVANGLIIILLLTYSNDTLCPVGHSLSWRLENQDQGHHCHIIEQEQPFGRAGDGKVQDITATTADCWDPASLRREQLDDNSWGQYCGKWRLDSVLNGSILLTQFLQEVLQCLGISKTWTTAPHTHTQ
jgi:hypothetical protein